MIKINIFNKIFRRKPPEPARAELITSLGPTFTPFSGNAYTNDIYRGAVDAIARNASKLKGTHVIKTDTGRDGNKSDLDRLLQMRPNPYISAFDMLYRLITHYYLYNNAFAYLQKDNRGQLMGIFPLKANGVEFMTDLSEELFCKFLLSNGKDYILPYSDIVHLRRNYNDNDLFGDPNTALIPALELAHTQNEGIIKGISNSANIRGILKFTQVLAPDMLKEERENFISDYMRMNNNGGVVVTDAKAEYSPINNKPYVIDEKQLQATKDKIYSYLGVSEKIVNSSYNENEWAAFYESVIEPIAVQLSLEFTEKVFTPKEQAFGNSILFEANRLQFTNARTKAALINELMPLGLLSVNQSLEILNLPRVPDGDRRIISLNYINAEKADQYQLGAEASDTVPQNSNEEVQDVAEEVSGKQLNGAQTQSLLNVMARYATKDLTLGQAINIIAISIGVSRQQAKNIIEGLE